MSRLADFWLTHAMDATNTLRDNRRLVFYNADWNELLSLDGVFQEF